MDLNYLLFRHQASLMRAADSNCQDATMSHRRDVAHYARQIGILRAAMGATALMPLPVA
jgi:hypothetical protein